MSKRVVAFALLTAALFCLFKLLVVLVGFQSTVILALSSITVLALDSRR